MINLFNVMEMSHDLQNVRRFLKTTKQEPVETSNVSRLPLETSSSNMIDEIIDVSNIPSKDDENWLWDTSNKNSGIQDLKRWIYGDATAFKDFDFHTDRLIIVKDLSRVDAKKNIDSRTFTRPKRRFNRPSIESYEEHFRNDKGITETIPHYVPSDENEINRVFKSKNCDNIDIAQMPLDFDFSQPTSSSIFEKILLNASGDDSFQNMSPPSLINSMCSSTFTNLMENSMIKNDPLLREISVTDYTEAMLQDYDPPLFKSITDSCSSINLDNPETFIKENCDSTLNNVYKKNISGCLENILNETYIANNSDSTLEDCVKESSSDVSSVDVFYNNETVILMSNKEADESPNLNGTYNKSQNCKINSTFQKSPLYHSNENLNATVIYGKDTNKLNNTKRHSYAVDTRNELNQTICLKRSSYGHSAGSTDSLDYLSSLSSGSRDSNKMLNMAEVDAIVLQQEQSLEQVMSTPKSASKALSRLWENGISPVSPLNKSDLSDSDSRSSNDDYRTVRSNLSSNDDPSDTPSTDPVHAPYTNNVKSTNLNCTITTEVKSLGNTRMPDIRGSYSNLKTVGTSLKGSYTNLKPIGTNFKSTGSISTLDNKGSNLRSMKPSLKGSYTQLKPVLLNRPGSNLKLNDHTSMKPVAIKSQSNVKIAEVSPTLRDFSSKDQVKLGSTNNAVKPQLKASGLPRPVSSIPRPTSSKIPAPKSRTTNTRQLSRPASKNSLDYDF